MTSAEHTTETPSTTPSSAAKYALLKAALLDLPAAIAKLPESEQAAYVAAQQSVIDARRQAEREAPIIFIA